MLDEFKKRLGKRLPAILKKYPDKNKLVEVFSEQRQVRLNSLVRLSSQNKVSAINSSNRAIMYKVKWAFNNGMISIELSDDE